MVDKTTEIIRFDGVTVSEAYWGDVSYLRRIGLKWRKVKSGDDVIEVLTLDEIREQAFTKHKVYAGLITVFTEQPFGGAIYQYNEKNNEWKQIGAVDGYA